MANEASPARGRAGSWGDLGCRLSASVLLIICLLTAADGLQALRPKPLAHVVAKTTGWTGPWHVWLPGGQVVFQGCHIGWHLDLRVLDVHTGRDRPACTPRSELAKVFGPLAASVSVSPNARRVVLTGSSTTLITCDADGGRRTVWRTGGYDPFCVLWAPDSRQFATLEFRGDTYRLAFRPACGTGWTRVAAGLRDVGGSNGNTHSGFVIGPDTLEVPPDWKQPERVRALLWQWRRRGAVRVSAVYVRRPARGSIWQWGISPDGHRILYRVTRHLNRRYRPEDKWPDFGTALYVSRLDGSGLHTLATWDPLMGDKAHLHATWLPDSRHISVAAVGKLMIMDAGRE